MWTCQSHNCTALVMGVNDRKLLRAVPETILGGGALFFFRPLHPQDTHGVRAPRPPGHVSALINLPHYGSNTHPPLLGHIVNKTPSTHRTKKCLRSPPPPRIISGTALKGMMVVLLMVWLHPEIGLQQLHKSHKVLCTLFFQHRLSGGNVRVRFQKLHFL